ncbi:unnamed protein product [Lupinus luteus]|uniref:Vacuolar protein sorting-associated protein 62 n=1 Tax=Lupinus luteus TaxID=3873 RepID=A0AAV1XXN7_LUPLU
MENLFRQEDKALLIDTIFHLPTPLSAFPPSAKDVSSKATKPTLKQPSDYKLVWNTESLNINQEGHAYVWLPKAPKGYKVVEHVVTTTPDKPSLNKIRCVGKYLTAENEQYSLIWSNNDIFVYDERPSNRGTHAPGVSVADGANKDRVIDGDLNSAKSYVHVKPMYGGTFIDLALWVFYPFNEASSAKVKFIKNTKLGKMGEHVGDWEHVTLRVSNFNGQLCQMYFSQHNKGTWLDASQLEFKIGNKPIVYFALHVMHHIHMLALHMLALLF